MTSMAPPRTSAPVAATMAQAALIEALDAGVKPILQCIRDQFAHLRTYARLS
jgi:hypothetical protein